MYSCGENICADGSAWYVQYLKPLNPKNDQHQLSPCYFNALYNRVVTRIQDRITQDESVLLDILTTSPNYISSKCIWKEMRIYILILGFKGLIKCCETMPDHILTLCEAIWLSWCITLNRNE